MTSWIASLRLAADAVDSSEALDDAHGVPVDVVVDAVVAVLQVLPLGDAVRRDQDVDVLRVLGVQHVPVLGLRGEAGQDVVHLGLEPRNRRLAVDRPRDEGRVESQLRFRHAAHVLVQVFRRVRKGGEDQDLLVAGVDRLFDLLADYAEQLAQLVVVLRGDVLHHADQQGQSADVLVDVPLP